MITQTKYRILAGSVILLLILNGATIATLVYHTRSEANRQPSQVNASQGSPAAEQGARFFREQLNLDAVQTDRFREINRDYYLKTNGLTLDLEKLRREMIDRIAEDKPDTLRLHAISQDIGKKHEELKNLTIEYYLRMKSVCTKEQQEKLYNFFLGMVQKDATAATHPGKGKGPRWHGGR
jgi:Spy/CpxP family protein refolding chaperone